MKLHMASRLLTWVAPAIAGSLLTHVPAQAATLASSQGLTHFFNFNLSPLSTNTVTDTNALAISIGGNAVAFADAEALFTVIPPQASNSATAIVQGTTPGYAAQATSFAAITGIFSVADIAQQGSLQFDFTASLNLITSINNQQTEAARASGLTSVLIFAGANPGDTTSLLDGFAIAGNLATPGSNDFLNARASSSFTFSAPSLLNSGGNQELAVAGLNGSYQRSYDAQLFANQSYITLVEYKLNQVEAVAVPEPSVVLGVIVSGVAVICKKRRLSADPD